nr:MAG TPA: hypothetical protein [Bacteriophage sp.]
MSLSVSLRGTKSIKNRKCPSRTKTGTKSINYRECPRDRQTLYIYSIYIGVFPFPKVTGVK